MHERETDNQIPSSITPEGEELFEDLFGIPFKAAQVLATWDGEIGQRYKNIFKLIKEAYDTNRQESESSREAE